MELLGSMDLNQTATRSASIPVESVSKENISGDRYDGKTFLEYAQESIDELSDTNGTGTGLLFDRTENTLISIGYGSGLTFKLEYAKHSTDENPVMLSQGIDENGKPFEEYIYINNIDPTYANVIEMEALGIHLGLDKSVGGGLSTIPLGMGNCGKNEYFDFTKNVNQEISNQTILGQFDAVDKLEKYLEQILDFMKEFESSRNKLTNDFQANLQGELESQLLLMQCR